MNRHELKKHLASFSNEDFGDFINEASAFLERGDVGENIKNLTDKIYGKGMSDILELQNNRIHEEVVKQICLSAMDRLGDLLDG